MRCFAALAVLMVSIGGGRGVAKDSRNADAAANVNSRYTVESVEVSPKGQWSLSASTRERIRQFIGARFDQALLDDLVSRIRKELRDRPVSARLDRGTTADHVRITLHVEIDRSDVDFDLSRLLYHSRQNFSFGLDVSYRQDNHKVHFGALTDNNELAERYSGVRGGYVRSGLAAGRVAIGVEAAAVRSQWNAATETAASTTDLYRQRQQLEPTATITIFQPLTLQLGVSIGRLEPNLPSARNETSSAALGTLRFQRRWGLASSNNTHKLEAAYGLRAATRTLASDYVFTRHFWMAKYSYLGNHEELSAGFEAGLVNGRAPLNERFVAGNAFRLRGWNKYDLAPAGASRMAVGTFDYRWRKLRLVYDVGAVWVISGPGAAGGGDGKLRHSAAVGVTESRLGGFSLLLAFPLRQGRMEPILIAGMNF